MSILTIAIRRTHGVVIVWAAVSLGAIMVRTVIPAWIRSARTVQNGISAIDVLVIQPTPLARVAPGNGTTSQIMPAKSVTPHARIALMERRIAVLAVMEVCYSLTLVIAFRSARQTTSHLMAAVSLLQSLNSDDSR
jgi:hypothetical protein